MRYLPCLQERAVFPHRLNDLFIGFPDHEPFPRSRVFGKTTFFVDGHKHGQLILQARPVVIHSMPRRRMDDRDGRSGDLTRYATGQHQGY